MRNNHLTPVLGTLLMAAVLSPSCIRAGEPPVDKPSAITDAESVRLERALKPLIAEAQRTYPAAKARYDRGLPSGYRFYVVTRLFDSSGRYEQVFVRVQATSANAVTGQLASEINLIRGYKSGDKIEVRDDRLIDWLIADPSGSEEGNVVGKFMDTYQPQR